MEDNLWTKLNESSEIFDIENAKLLPLLGELSLIRDSTIKDFTRAMLLAVDEFWDAPSSVSGKYHPPDEHGMGGDVLHTQRVVAITALLAESQERDQYETDILISAAILHDITKVIRWAPDVVSSDPLHPITVTSLFNKLRKKEEEHTEELGSNTLELDSNTIDQILRLVRCHLGIWGPIPEIIPMTPFEMIVHQADYIAANLHKIVEFNNVELPTTE